MATEEGKEAVPFDVVVGSATEELEAKISKARAYAQRLGTTSASSPRGHIFINGKYYPDDDVCCSILTIT
jgi:UDP-glucose:glycoprotein glucosyltransferase